VLVMKGATMAGRRGPNKRHKGSGSVFKIRRGDYDYWCGQVDAGRHPNGKRRYVTVTRRTKREVLDEMDELRRRAGAGVVGRDQSVGALIDEWLAVRGGRLSATSHAVYSRRAEGWIKPFVGHVPLRKLTSGHVRSMMAALEAQGLSPRTANHAKSLLSSVLRWAVGERRITDNPAERVEGAKLGAKLDDGLSKAEADAVLAAAKGDRLYPLLYLSLTLGLRQGEALDLRWSDIDLDAEEIRIDQAKTRSGERSLPLVASTAATLREHRKVQAAERLAIGRRWNDDDRVFARPDGRRIATTSLLGWWGRVCDGAGVERRRWHALRHSAAERMLDAGVPMELVSVVLGHSGVTITADVYSRWSNDTKRRELSKYMDDSEVVSPT
jgi:integrase